MRRIDRWLGVPLCWALTLLRRCGDLWRRVRKPKPAEIRRIVFVKLAEQGATVLAYPAIGRAVEMVGRENVYFLVFEENRCILDLLEVVPPQNVITIPTNGLGASLVGAMGALWRLRKSRPDAAVDFEFFARSSAALTYLSGARTRVGLHRFGDRAPYRGDLMTHRIRYDPQLHTTQAFAAMVEAIRFPPKDLPAAAGPADDAPGPTDHAARPTFGRCPARRCPLPPVDDSQCVFRPKPEELAHLKAVIRREARSADYGPLVLLNANASDLLPLRRWPEDRYVELARRLLQRSSRLHVAFTGSPDEAAVAEDLVGRIGSERCFSMAGKTTLRELLVLYSLADLLVTNDSGPAHFATLTPIRVITLFGPETPALFGSKSPRVRVLWKGLSCSPCVNAYNNRLSTCRDNRCMREITVDEVARAACEVLNL
jgi:ADP-heptose:LPS heptosyltransferase